MSFTFEPANAKTEFPGGEITVRGLGSEDLTALARQFREPLSELFDRLMASGDADLGVTAVLGESAIKDSPVLLAAILCVASDTPLTEIDRMKRVPFTAQLRALGDVGRLTFHSDDDLKKALATVVAVLDGVTSVALTKVAPPDPKP